MRQFLEWRRLAAMVRETRTLQGRRPLLDKRMKAMVRDLHPLNGG